ncbi:MAG: hypothetical protein ACRCYV_11555, partial [Aeromonas sp.]
MSLTLRVAAAVLTSLPLVALHAAPALGDSPVCAPQQTLFYCVTTNQKVLALCYDGTQVGYQFGKLNKVPDLQFSKPKADAATYQWSGMGSVMRYSVQLSRGNTHYTVFSESVRSPDGESM